MKKMITLRLKNLFGLSTILLFLLLSLSSQKASATVSFVGGARQTYVICQGGGPGAARDITPFLGVSETIAGVTETWNVTLNPTLGSLTGFSTSSTFLSGTLYPSSGIYTPFASSIGTDSFTISVSDGSSTATTTIVITINPLPIVGAFHGVTHQCIGASSTLTNDSSGGVWSTGPASIATIDPSTGVITGVSAGVVSVVYSKTNPVTTCLTVIAFDDTVQALPTVSTPTGSTSVCVGSSITLSDATSGGTWSARTGNATVNPASGVVTGVAAGTDYIIYSVTNSCGTASDSILVTINTAGAGSISPSGSPSVCISGTLAMSSTVSGGTWSSSASSVATINPATGLLTGIAAGSTTVAYNVTSGCGSFTVFQAVSVVTTPTAPSAITGRTNICIGSADTLSSATSGGSWTSSNPSIATIISGTGIVGAGSTVGSTTITYTVTNSCGTSFTTTTLNVGTVPGVPSSITGPTSACSGSTNALGDATTGGTWSSSNTTVASVDNSGNVNAITGGTATITYTVTNGCGSSFTTSTFTVTTTPTTPAAITGPSTVCVGANIGLTSATSGGSWSSTNTSVATVSGTGSVHGIAAGATIISYTVSNSCGTAGIATTITVSGAPATPNAITGVPTACVGSTSALADATASGVWSSTNGAVASVNTSGLVTAVSTGTATISYTVSGTCGVSAATVAFTVNTTPTVSAITGANSMCTGATTTLTDVTTGGTWSSSNTSVASIASTASGAISTAVISGISAGIVTISYTLTNSCGPTTVTFGMTIISAPSTPAAITGAASVCTNDTTTLRDATSGGTWSSTSTSVASINGVGKVTAGASAGTTVISYTLTNACGTAGSTYTFSVIAAPTIASAITGTASVCVGGTTTLANTSTSTTNTWSSSVPSVATVDGFGNVHGVAAGTSRITYTISNTCGSDFRTRLVTVTAGPSVPSITSGASSVCVSASATQTGSPIGGTWTNANTSIGSITSATGVYTGIAGGTDTITYTITATCGTNFITKVMTVNTVPVIPAIGGATSVCVGSTTNLTESISGVWSTANSSIASVNSATGVVTGIGTGTTTITFTAVNSCGSNFITQSMTVNTIPTAPAAISGANTVCAGFSITLTDAASSGTWSSTNTSAATVTATGTVNGVAVGSTVISYTVSNACGIRAATHAVSVTSTVTVAAITGTATICVGSNSTLADGTSGGTWSSDNTAVVTVNGSGVAHGVSVGSANIIYTVTNTCGTASVSRGVTIITVPDTPAVIGGANVVCRLGSITLTDATSGGVWSSVSPAVATVNSSTGVVTGVSVGTAVISYTVTNACGATARLDTITVIDVPATPSAITGPSSVCLGTTIALSDTTGGGSGTWVSSSPTTAAVDGVGNVTGLTVGTFIISYTVSNSCGSSSPAIKRDTVTNVPGSSSILGTAVVCVGSTTILTNATTGGTWSSSSPSVASVDASGLVTGIAGGTASITYAVTNACGVTNNSRVVTVTTVPAVPGAINGASTICQGATTNLTDTTAGGVWSSSNPTVASITSGGVVSGLTTGTAVISYTATNSCGSTSQTLNFTVITTPVVPPITGPTRVCIGSTVTLSNTMPGGTWFSTNTGVATISSSGVLGGVSAGTTGIFYFVSNACGTGSWYQADTVNSGFVSAITGASDVCIGSTTTLSNVTTGGTWSSQDIAVATINPTTGVVTGVAIGATTISYTVVNACGTNVSTFPMRASSAFVAAITGSSTVCVGAGIVLSDTTYGGTWASSNPSAAIINSATGVVTGIAPGSTVIGYTVVNGCGTHFAFYNVTVNPLAVPGTVSGASVVCEGSNITLTDPATGGVWSSDATSIATVTSGGIVHGVSAGSATISYTVTNGCGPQAATQVVTVNPLPHAGIISGAAAVCEASTTTLTSSVSGGVWSNFDPAVTTVDPATGIVTGVGPGTDTIYYTYTNSCGTDVSNTTILVNPSPIVGAISGSSSVCALAATTLSESVTGGTWSSTNTSIATIDGAGVVTGVSAGLVSISYTLTSGAGCTAAATLGFTVNPLPSATTIGGTPVVCEGGTTTLTNGIGGGTWISDNIFMATVDAAGDVTGVSAGATIITYEVINGCGVADSTISLTVNPRPDAGFLSGASSVCVGSITTIFSTTSGGTWSSSDASIATVDPATGDVLGIAPGTATITYEVSNSCGTSDSTFSITVLQLPYAGVISGTTDICASFSSAMSSSVGAGGLWFSSDVSVAVVDVSTGLVTGVGEGLCLISYSVTNSCGTDVATTFFTVHNLPFAGPITGTDSVCVGALTYLSDSVAGGAWSSANPSIADIDAFGVVTGYSAGTVRITYTIHTATCGDFDTTTLVRVLPLPNAGGLTGPSVMCVAAGSTFTSSSAGGVWSSSDATIATVDPASGAVTALTVGFVDISYTVTNSCGSNSNAITVMVNPLPFAASITGVDSVCQYETDTLHDATAGGLWTASSAVATVDPSGVVTGLLAGTAYITYSITNSCGTADSIFAVRVLPAPVAGTIAFGTGRVCERDTIRYASSAAGGVWSSTDTTIARIDATTGLITGVTAGRARITYSVTNSCGTAFDTATIIVNPQPRAGFITGANAVCAGASTNLSDATGTTGGVWTASGAVTVAAATGVVTGSATLGAGVVGTGTVTYTATTVCGTADTTFTVTVNPLPDSGTVTGADSVCAGASITLTHTGSMPGTWSSSNVGVATVNNVLAGGVVVGVAAGSAVISYTVTTATCGTAYSRHTVYVNPLPVPGVISTSTTNICVAQTVAFTESSAGGIWYTLYPSIATVTTTGSVTGVAPGVDTIYYVVTNGCGADTARQRITIIALPTPGTISGTSPICVGHTSNFTDTAIGGVWTSTNTGVATVSALGVVRAVAAGTSVISYTVTSGAGCGTAAATYNLTVDPVASRGTIYGPASVCVASTITLHDTTGTAGGAWHTSNASVATINGSTGLLTGLTAGTVQISYVATTACGSDSAGYTVTVNPLPNADVITGASAVCVGSTITMVDTGGGSGGTWSVSPTGFATISSSGVLRGVAAGTVLVSYAVTNSCGTAYATAHSVTINASPSAGTISGADSVCVTSTTTLTDTAAGGIWRSSSTTFAVVGATTGIVTGVSAGTVSISYVVTSASCGSDSVGISFHVKPLPDTGVISGSPTVCVGAYDTLSETATGGSWASSNTSVAVVSASGIVRGISAGTATISYTATNDCGTRSSTFTITVNPLPFAGTISGTAAICNGTSETLSTTGTPGGVWSSVGAGVDSINAVTGDLYALAAGTDIVTYTSSTALCGTSRSYFPITIRPLPSAGVISGPTTVCVGSSVTLAATVSGGSWFVTSSELSVTSAGVVTGISAGTAYVSYTVTSPYGCRPDTTWYLMTVNPLPDAGTLSGVSALCVGASGTLTTTGVTGGAFTTSGASIATVDSSGHVTAVAAGTVTVTYTVTTPTCGTDVTYTSITVHPLADAGAVNVVTDTLCAGGTTTLTATVSGGSWSATGLGTVVGTGSSALFTASSTTAAGTATVSYTVASPFGCTPDAVATATIYVNPYPSVASPGYSTLNVCVGNTISFSDATAGGRWGSLDPGNATVDSLTGVVTGVAAGTARIVYTVSNSCGITTVGVTVTVFSVPTAGTIVGPVTRCPGTAFAINYTTSGTAGGRWTTSDTTIGRIDTATGRFIAVNPGTVDISYTVSSALCGTFTTVLTVTVDPLPDGGTITGSDTVCVGAITVLNDFSPSGVWTSSTASVANVNTVGQVSGIAAGTATITYTVTNSCGSNSALFAVRVQPLPIAGTVTGSAIVCVGVPVNLTASLPGGIWSLTNSRANISGSGVVSGLTPGDDTATYSISNSCGTAVAIKVVTVTAQPVAGVITGPNHLCFSDSTTVMDTTLGGVWGVSNPGFATISLLDSIHARVYGVGAGTVIVTYTVTNVCGVAFDTMSIDIQGPGHCTDGVVSQIKSSEIGVYPNPAVSVLHIDAPVKVNITIISAEGKTVIQQNESADVDVSSLASGLYLVMIYDEHNTLLKTAKFVKAE